MRNKYVKTAHGRFELNSLLTSRDHETARGAQAANAEAPTRDQNGTHAASSRRVALAFERIERWLDANGATEIARNLAPPATRAQIDEVEAQLRTPLHPDLRALWSRHGGERGGRSHFVGGLELLAPASSSSWSSFIAAIVQNLRADPDLRRESQVTEQEAMSDAWLPVAYASKEEQVVVSCLTGRVFYCVDFPAIRLIAASVGAWLESYADRLEESEFRVDEASTDCKLTCDGELF